MSLSLSAPVSIEPQCYSDWLHSNSMLSQVSFSQRKVSSPHLSRLSMALVAVSLYWKAQKRSEENGRVNGVSLATKTLDLRSEASICRLECLSTTFKTERKKNSRMSPTSGFFCSSSTDFRLQSSVFGLFPSSTNGIDLKTNATNWIK